MKVGVLGGTFDPIHQGHVAIARRALETMCLDRIDLMVANVPPHKTKARLASPFHRFAMVALEARQHQGLYASDFEVQREAPAYTSDTLRALVENSPGCEFCFVAGTDSLSEIHTWKDYATLLSNYCFIFVERTGVPFDMDQAGIPGVLRDRITVIPEGQQHEIHPGRSFVIPSRHAVVSSTEIRNAIREAHELSPDLVSLDVLQHMRKYRLYE